MYVASQSRTAAVVGRGICSQAYRILSACDRNESRATLCCAEERLSALAVKEQASTSCSPDTSMRLLVRTSGGWAGINAAVMSCPQPRAAYYSDGSKITVTGAWSDHRSA